MRSLLASTYEKTVWLIALDVFMPIAFMNINNINFGGKYSFYHFQYPIGLTCDPVKAKL